MPHHRDLSVPLAKISEKLTLWIGSTASIIIHTIFFIGIFTLRWIGFSLDQILLILTTAVSLEAIYLAIFIQMTVNRNTQSLAGVEEDLEELGEEVEDIGEDIDRVGEKVEDLDEGLDELSEDVEEISEDVDKIQAEDAEDARHDLATRTAIDKIDVSMGQLMREIEALKETMRKQ
jgi:methyl-accepting chemotaxis protein